MLAELKGVKKSYGAFQLDVTMQLKEGRITGVVGKNGAGKSTTFKAMLGLIHTEGGSKRISEWSVQSCITRMGRSSMRVS